MKTVWIIEAVTNLHVGNEGASSLSVVDKEIQKDVLTKIPCINASSLKGAMNEFATVELEMCREKRIKIFGADKQEKANKESKKGEYSFFDAQLLAMPVQDDAHLYKLKTSEEQLQQFVALLNAVGVDKSFETLKTELEKMYGPYFDNDSVVSSAEFKEICANDELPIIARNCLETGRENLWYEQVLPRKSVLGTIVISKDQAGEDLIAQNFCDKVVQIGANATIGYGYCRFKKIWSDENEK